MKNLNFSTRRVAVMGMNGMLLYRVHPQEARRMVESEQAERSDDRTVRLLSGLSDLPRSERGVSRASESSLKTTFRQRLADGAQVIQHKFIDPSCEPIYRSAVLECLR